MFVYGPTRIADSPSRVILKLRDGERKVFDIANGISVLVAPGGEVVIALQDVDRPNSKDMRILWVFPWDHIANVAFEYDNPFPEPRLDPEREKELLQEMLGDDEEVPELPGSKPLKPTKIIEN